MWLDSCPTLDNINCRSARTKVQVPTSWITLTSPIDALFCRALKRAWYSCSSPPQVSLLLDRFHLIDLVQTDTCLTSETKVCQQKFHWNIIHCVWDWREVIKGCRRCKCYRFASLLSRLWLLNLIAQALLRDCEGRVMEGKHREWQLNRRQQTLCEETPETR